MCSFQELFIKYMFYRQKKNIFIGYNFISLFQKLEPGQVEKIIKNTTADSPLWVMYMAEELRIFGDFRLIAQRIERFPSSLDEFLVQILGRLIQEDDVQGIIKKVCFIAMIS